MIITIQMLVWMGFRMWPPGCSQRPAEEVSFSMSEHGEDQVKGGKDAYKMR